ncbi:MAG: nucleoside triphosphate pyrophosphohydrolase [Coriobacteriaceae bacterium]|jgi:tetrapyrrole methylase family protein/MazG family protein|nr:nucleoside triphosphate pyrophosphohydrolase [Coriobacteriaceae bacterium]
MPHHPAFDDFIETIAILRSPSGCPWDREQTHRSIASNMLEEAYEAVDAIEACDTAHLREELGDVLLQVVLQSQIAQDAGEFDIDDVCRDINEKMIRRHPHVFGEAQATSAGDVLELWDKVKQAENEGGAMRAAPSVQDGQPGASPHYGIHKTGLLDAVPSGFPALMQAQKISRKAVSAGFEWETLDEVWEQVFSEIDELKAAYASAHKDKRGKVQGGDEVELEFGDVLFSLVNVARKMGIDAEGALRAACAKFRARWAFIEGAAWARGKEANELAFEELEALWAKAKQHEACVPSAE